MKAATAIGIAVAAVGLLGGAVMEGTSPVAFINIPAILVVLGGTFGACMASCGLEGMKRLPALYKKPMNAAPPALPEPLPNTARYAARARRDGLLALEEELEQI